MNKDYITIIKSDGITEQMEVVATFKLEDTSKDCIIYKSLQKNRYYAASYKNYLDFSNLNTEFTEKEKEQLNKIFETINYRDGGEKNA